MIVKAVVGVSQQAFREGIGCSPIAFSDQDEGLCSLSLLQRHTELTRRSRPNSMAVAEEQVELAAEAIKATADASRHASDSLRGMRSAIASLAALDAPSASVGNLDLHAKSPTNENVDDLVADINQKVGDASLLLKAKVEAGAHSSEVISALRLSIANLQPASSVDPSRDDPSTPQARLDRLSVHASGATQHQKETWQPNSDSDPRMNWAKGDEAQGVGGRYSRLQPTNKGAPENPETYEALGSDTDREDKPVEIEESEGNDDRNDDASKVGGLFAPSKTDSDVDGNQTHEQSDGEKQEPDAAESNFAVRDAFDLFDEDGSATVDLAELKVAMKALGFAAQGSHQLMVDVDENHSGSIDYQEFLRLMLDHHLMGSA